MFANFLVYDPAGDNIFSQILGDWTQKFSKPQPMQINLGMVDYAAQSGRGSKLTLAGYAHMGGKDMLITASVDEVMGKMQEAGLASQFVRLTQGNKPLAVNIEKVFMISANRGGSTLRMGAGMPLKVEESPETIRRMAPKHFLDLPKVA